MTLSDKITTMDYSLQGHEEHFCQAIWVGDVKLAVKELKERLINSHFDMKRDKTIYKIAMEDIDEIFGDKLI